MKQLIKKLSAFVAVFALVAVATLVPVVPASAADSQADCVARGGTWSNADKKCSLSLDGGVDSAKGTGVPDTLFGPESIFTTIVNTLLFLIGAISVIMLIWGGIRYTTSAGNSASVTSAKNTIMYAIIGLIIAFLAFAIVNWVLVAVNPTP